MVQSPTQSCPVVIACMQSGRMHRQGFVSVGARGRTEVLPVMAAEQHARGSGELQLSTMA